jgi:hypothetical protein
MTNTPTLDCRDDSERRRLARAMPLNGLDYLEVSDDQRHLTVFFLEKAPQWLTARHLRIEGGQRVRGIRVLKAEIKRSDDPELDDCMTVTVDKPGDFSNYTLCVIALDEAGKPTGRAPADFDPRYTCLCFSFKAGCPGDLDCNTGPVCTPPVRTEPPIDYLARDYASCRRLILDRLALVMPEWQERHIPDLVITLVELLAYTGDYLSYYQDAVATEAYLDTARQRISVRRHARLVDYFLHEGCNARAWVTIAVSQDAQTLPRGDFYFITSTGDMGGRMLKAEDLPESQPAPCLVFEPLWPAGATGIELHADHNAIRFYTWSGTQCCLPKGSTSATLIDPGTIPAAPPPDPEPCEHDTPSRKPPTDTPGYPRPEDYRLHLKACDVLVFEEVTGPHTGNPADADPARRHAVRLTGVTPSWDPLTRQLVMEIDWAPEDALPFPLCISSIGPAPHCSLIPDVSIARGNVLLVDHGRSVDDELGQVPTRATSSDCGDGCLPPEVRKTPGVFRPVLPRPELTCSEPVPPCVLPPLDCGEGTRITAASSLLRQDPRAAVPWITLRSIPAAPNGEPAFAVSDLDEPTRLATAIAKLAKARGEKTPTSGEKDQGVESAVGDEKAGVEDSAPAEWLLGQLAAGVRQELLDWITKEPVQQLPVNLKDELLELLQSLEQAWEARQDLLESGPDDRHFVVEIDDARKARVRFGDGDCGRLPDAGASFRAAYRVGNGTVGNVGAETITRIVFRTGFPGGVDLRPRNPLPAMGGQAPELVPEARLRAPHVFHSRLERAITADDYAAIVMRDFASRVQRAAAALCWNGIGPQVLVAVDALGKAEADPALLCEIGHHLWRYRRMGHDVQVEAAQAVPLDIGLFICVCDGYLRGHVKAALLDACSNRLLPGGQRGFFHPDKLSFGQGIYLSQVVATAQAVEGVESVRVIRFERLYEGPNGEIAAGVLPLGPLEVARLDNDPGFPERGRLTLKLEGGR